MSKKQELVQATTTELTAVNMSDWGDVIVESKDLILPRILLQQALSESVKARIARDGDYLNTLTGEVCSNDKGIVMILPFYCRQNYIIEKWNGKKYEFHKVQPYVPGEALKPFEEEIAGDKFKNSHVYEFFCLTEGGGTPSIVSFKSTSHKTGKQLFNLMYLQNPQQKKTPAHNWIALGSKQETNDMGTFNVMTIAVDKQSTPEELTNCLSWISTIRQSEFKVAEESSPSHTTETRF